MLRDDINNAVKDAMKAKDERKLSTLRMVNSTIKNADIEARGQGKPPLSDADLLGVFQKMIKQRQESVELYDKGGRAELAAQEREEIAIISAYLPKQMSDDDVKAAISAAIAETGAAGMKDMGKVIGVLRAKYAGQMDFGKASGLVKAALTAASPRLATCSPRMPGMSRPRLHGEARSQRQRTMLTEAKTYDELYRNFRWDIPARFNIATACCDRHADGTGRLALVYVDEDGGITRTSFDEVARRLAPLCQCAEGRWRSCAATASRCSCRNRWNCRSRIWPRFAPA